MLLLMTIMAGAFGIRWTVNGNGILRINIIHR
jgi:hypothetical protein